MWINPKYSKHSYYYYCYGKAWNLPLNFTPQDSVKVKNANQQFQQLLPLDSFFRNSCHAINMKCFRELDAHEAMLCLPLTWPKLLSLSWTTKAPLPKAFRTLLFLEYRKRVNIAQGVTINELEIKRTRTPETENSIEEGKGFLEIVWIPSPLHKRQLNKCQWQNIFTQNKF